jgi:hypothetical protein
MRQDLLACHSARETSNWRPRRERENLTVGKEKLQGKAQAMSVGALCQSGSGQKALTVLRGPCTLPPTCTSHACIYPNSSRTCAAGHSCPTPRAAQPLEIAATLQDLCLNLATAPCPEPYPTMEIHI